MNKSIKIFGLMLLIAMLLTACGPAATPVQPTQAAPAQPTAAPVATDTAMAATVRRKPPPPPQARAIAKALLPVTLCRLHINGPVLKKKASTRSSNRWKTPAALKSQANPLAMLRFWTPW